MYAVPVLSASAGLRPIADLPGFSNIPHSFLLGADYISTATEYYYEYMPLGIYYTTLHHASIQPFASQPIPPLPP